MATMLKGGTFFGALMTIAAMAGWGVGWMVSVVEADARRDAVKCFEQRVLDLKDNTDRSANCAESIKDWKATADLYMKRDAECRETLEKRK